MKLVRTLAFCLSLALIVSITPVTAIGAQMPGSEGKVLSAFKNPDYKDKPMARMWFPDAGAAFDSNNTIDKQIDALAAAGFGGVEVTMLSDGALMTNDEAKYVGWGTPAWKTVLKQVLYYANTKYPGFIVDITITAHWPCIMNNIDPNDDAQQQETAVAFKKVSTSDLNNAELSLALPTPMLYDSAQCPFIVKDTLVSAALVKVTTVSNGTPTAYDFNSIIGLNTTAYGGHAAGIPDAAAVAAYYSGTTVTVDSVNSLWGAAPASGADLSKSFNGKEDTWGNRARMADWQYEYKTDLTYVTSQLGGYQSSSGTGIAPGDYVLMGVYRRGTGEVMSNGQAVLMYGRTYTTNYFNSDGNQAIFSYWENNLLNDQELVDLLKQNKGSIFEDSIELTRTKGTSFWSYDLLDGLSSGYAYKTQLPIVTALGSTAFDIASPASRVSQDYDSLIGGLYETKHLRPIKEWAATFGYSFRAQARGIPQVDATTAPAILNTAEGDNGTKGDGIRRNTGLSLLSDDHQYISMEAATGYDNNMKMNWTDYLTELNQNFSDGCNHVILHGTPYSKSWTGFNAEWPGWMQFGGAFAGSVTYHQTYWDDMSTFGNYIARNQVVLRNGTEKPDLAIVTPNSDGGSGNAFQTLLDNGYSYNTFTQGITELANAKVEMDSSGQKVVDASGPAYKALIISGLTTLSKSAASSFLQYAQDGLPIILIKTNPTAVPGTETGTSTDVAMTSVISSLKALPNVYTAASQDDIVSHLKSIGVLADTSYSQPALEATHYADNTDGSDYYYLMNNPNPKNNSFMTAGSGGKYTKGAEINTTVILKGDGTPYTLDAWTGEVTPICNYTVNGNGTISVNVSLSGGASTIIGLIGNDACSNTYVTNVSGSAVYYNDGDTVFRSNTAGDYSVQMSDGSTKNVQIDKTLDDVDLSSGWDLELQSWGPDYSADNVQDRLTISGLSPNDVIKNTYPYYKDPSASTVTTVNFSNIKLDYWSKLPATSDQLAVLGVTAMKYVSGVGYYTKTFSLPDGWTSSTGAVLKFSSNMDEVTQITVNGHTFDNIDVITGRLDIGKDLVAGQNTVTIKLCTELFNRASVVNTIYTSGGTASGFGNISLTPSNYGLSTVTLSPYTQVSLTTSAAAGNILEQVWPVATAALVLAGAGIATVIAFRKRRQ